MQARNLFRPGIFLSLLPLLFSASLLAQYDQSYQGDPPASIARIGYLNGNVSLQAYGSDQWADAPMNYPMVGGDRLYTGPGSRAVVQLGGAEMRIWQATDVTLTNLSDNFEQIGLAQGAMRLRVFQMEPGSQIEVDTPNGAALINSPGDYRIEAFAQGQNGGQDASSILTINSGNAQLTGPNINLPVSGGYSVGLFGQNPVQLQYLDVPDYDDLDYWSLSLDQRLQNSVSARYVSRQMVGYGDLDANGTWSQDPEYGPVWYPNSVPYGWQPYSTGHWAYVQPWGYTWVDDAPWGFAPFHYGRWSQRGDRWGWFPGPPAVRPVYSPALVAFVGGSPDEGRRGGGGISIGISFGGGGGGISAWFPIGVGEPYVPWYRCSPHYAQQVNVTNVNVNVIRNTTVVNNYNTYINKTVINNTTVNNVTVNNFNYSNRRAITAVPINAVSSGAPVGRQMIRLNAQQQQQVAQAPISVRPTAPQPVAAHPSLMPVSNVARPVARPLLMTPTGQARAVASPVLARPVAVNQLPPARVLPRNAPPPPAAPKPIEQTRINQPVNASQPIRPVIQPAPVARPVTQPVQQPVARPAAPLAPRPVQQPVGRPVAPTSPIVTPAPVTRPLPPQQGVSRPVPVTAPPAVQRPVPPQQQQPQPRQSTPPEQVNRPAQVVPQRPAPDQNIRPFQPPARQLPPEQQVKPQPEPARPAPQVRPVTPPPQPQVQPRPIPQQPQVRPRPDDRPAPKPKDEPKQDQKPN